MLGSNHLPFIGLLNSIQKLGQRKTMTKEYPRSRASHKPKNHKAKSYLILTSMSLRTNRELRWAQDQKHDLSILQDS